MLAYGYDSIKKNGVYAEILKEPSTAGKTMVEFSGITPNPTHDKVLEGARLAKEFNADLILGVGGGSVMDCCKAISMAARYPGDIWTDFCERLNYITFDPLNLDRHA